MQPDNNQSPNKKGSFRSRTKPKDGQMSANILDTSKQSKIAVSYKMYLKQFPLGMAEDAARTIQAFEPIYNDYIGHLDNLKLYKPALAFQFENSWAEFMDVLKAITVKLNRRTERVMEQKQAKILQLLSINSQKEQQIQNIKDKLDNIQNLRRLEGAELTAANTELQIVNRQMADIYTILRNDMGKVLRYLTSVDESKKDDMKNDTEKLYKNFQDFSTLLNSMQAEQKLTDVTLNSMRETIKAMARSTKSHTATQVDQSELQAPAADLFSTPNTQHNSACIDATAVNSMSATHTDHTLDQLKLKQKQYAHQSNHIKRGVQKPWTLTPTLLIFLENMSKENETGRVLPWQYMKVLIAQIYSQRIKLQEEMISGMVGNAMLFDEFVVFYFLKKFRIRRLAEVKLLEFVISLKYYSKFWVKVETFCCMMNVMKFLPMADPSDTFNYRMDYYTQNFFFHVYRKLTNQDLIEQPDGTMYVPTQKVKDEMRLMLFFTEDMNRSRLCVKLDKDIRIFDKVQCADFDFAMLLFLEEFHAVRKKNVSILSRQFFKLTEKVQGFVSIDELLNIFNEFSSIYNAGSKFKQKYPVESSLHISKLYLYAITSGKNNYEISNSHFISACQRYGFDCPFPFLHTCSKQNRQRITHRQSPVAEDRSPAVVAENIKVSETESNKISQSDNKNQEKIQIMEGKSVNINQERIDVGSKLFSQHFSLLKELKDYVQIFANTLAKEKDPEVLWKSFNQIKAILEKGCQFMRYPLLNSSEAKKMV